ncbi:TRIC cation channel family protein [Rhodovibrionaceae bacterium A322]
MTPGSILSRTLSIGLVMVLLLPLFTSSSAGVSDSRHIVASWYPAEPYQFFDTRRGNDKVTGLDIELAREILESAGYVVTFQPSNWAQIQKDLEVGKIDLALGAFKTHEREDFALFSAPYRTEKDKIFLPRNSKIGKEVSSFDQLFKIAVEQDLHIGVLHGYSYGEEADALLDQLKPHQRLVFRSIKEAITALSTNGIGALIADEFVAESAIFDLSVEGKISRHEILVFEGPIHAMFSKKSVDESVIADFNHALEKIKKDGRYEAIQRANITPIHFSNALSGGWFQAMDIIGTIAFAISGVLLARKENYSIFGALVLAALPAVGGGVVRDLLTGRQPIGILQSPLPLLLVIGTVLLGYLINIFIRKTYGQHLIAYEIALLLQKVKRYVEPGNFFQVFDAIGMSAFTITGVYVASIMDTDPLWLWGPLLATFTAAGGGIIRDVVRADKNNPSLKSSFYAEIPLVWGLLLSLFIWYWGPTTPSGEIFFAVMITVVGAFLTRMAVVIWKVPSPRF